MINEKEYKIDFYSSSHSESETMKTNQIDKDMDDIFNINQFSILSSAINYVEEAVGILDLNGNYIIVNNEFSRTIGDINKNTNIKDNSEEEFKWEDILLCLQKMDWWYGKVNKIFMKNEKKLCDISYNLIRNYKNQPIAVVERIKICEKQNESIQNIIKLANIGKLTAGLVHEINNQLSIILGYSEYILQYNLPLSPKVKNKVEKIFESAQNCYRLVNGLLSFSRCKKSERKKIDINKLILEIVDLKKYDLRLKNILIETNLSKDIPYISVEPIKIQQVLLNLLNNAGESINNNGVIKIISYFKDKKVFIEVIDNGKGISKEIQKHLFSPFYTSRTGDKGTGLGLSISKDIIEEYGGKIFLDPNYKNGAKFVFNLPVLG